jgi:hypothetical protein
MHLPNRNPGNGNDGAERMPGQANVVSGSFEERTGRPSPIHPDHSENPNRLNGNDSDHPPPTDDKSDDKQAPDQKS